MATLTALILAWALALTTPCPTEDASSCYWDASAHGNGVGTSFVDVEGTLYVLGGK